MAFQLLWDETSPLDFDYATNGTEGVVTSKIGYDDVTDDTYSLMVSLSPPAGAADGEYELVFCVIQYDHDEECAYQLWDGLQTRFHIPEAKHRAACMAAVCTGIDILIDEHSPHIVSMIAYTPSLPAKALQKYHIVASVFAEAGFTIGQPDPFHDRQMWLMERVS